MSWAWRDESMVVQENALWPLFPLKLDHCGYFSDLLFVFSINEVMSWIVCPSVIRSTNNIMYAHTYINMWMTFSYWWKICRKELTQ